VIATMRPSIAVAKEAGLELVFRVRVITEDTIAKMFFTR
jgi:hypothetical protein